MNIRLGLEQMGHGMHDLSPFLDNLNFKHLIGIRKDLKKKQYLHLRSIIVVYMCIELCVTQTFITQPYFRKQFPVHKPKVPSSRFHNQFPATF